MGHARYARRERDRRSEVDLRVAMAPSPLSSNPKCAACGDTPSCGDGSWRWSGTDWEHRCKDAHPQTGHWVVKP